MLNAQTALFKSRHAMWKKVKKAVQKSIKAGETSATVDVAVTERIAARLAAKGFDVLVFDKKGWTKSTTVLYTNATKERGNILFTDDEVKAGRTGQGICIE